MSTPVHKYTEKSIVDGTVFMLETVAVHTFRFKSSWIAKKRTRKNMFLFVLRSRLVAFLWPPQSNLLNVHYNSTNFQSVYLRQVNADSLLIQFVSQHPKKDCAQFTALLTSNLRKGLLSWWQCPSPHLLIWWYLWWLLQAADCWLKARGLYTLWA